MTIPFLRTKFDRKSFLASVFLLSLGRASFLPWLSPLTATFGYALALRTIASAECRKAFVGWLLFFSSVLLQSSWLISHPYFYIVVVWLLLSALFAIPYAALSYLCLTSPVPAFGWAALFTLAEWGFTQIPCGYPFLCAATHLSGLLFPMQLASIIGGIGLSFVVFWTNLLAYRKSLLVVPVALCPYIVGGVLYYQRSKAQATFDLTHRPISAAIVHMEEPPDVYSKNLPPVELHTKEWNKVFRILKELKPGDADLVILPEGVAPYPAPSALFPTAFLPRQWARGLELFQKQQACLATTSALSSLDLAKVMALSLSTPIILGLEGRGILKEGRSLCYNSCYFVVPDPKIVSRYDKQLLLPLGEYIPTKRLQWILSKYGIHGSFSAGKGPVLFRHGSLRVAPLICYEETFSSYVFEAGRLRPNLIVAVSNDCWYPRIGSEHFELSRLRAAEIGVPLIRSSNGGRSGAVDALGRIVSSSSHKEACLHTALSAYCVPSLFARVGENIFAIFFLFLWAGAWTHASLTPYPQKPEDSPLS